MVLSLIYLLFFSLEVQEDTNNSFNHAKLPIANPLMTSSQQAKYNEVSSDLADVISGLYRLLD